MGEIFSPFIFVMDMLSDIADAYHSSDFFQVLQLHLDIIIRTDLILQIAILNEILNLMVIRMLFSPG